MIVKMFEVRDRSTLIPVMAIKFADATEPELRLLNRGGFGGNPEALSRYTIVVKTTGECEAKCDPFDWTGSRTMREAHRYIESKFGELSSGDVVDVEYILGETTEVKASDFIVTNTPN